MKPAGSAQFRRRRALRQPAFTLLEMVIAIGLFILLMATLYGFYNTALVRRDEGQEISRNAQLARVVLDRMAREIRQISRNVPGYGPGLIGIEDNEFGPTLSMTTVVVPDKALSEPRQLGEQPLPGQFDVQNIVYSVVWDYENLDTNGEPVALGLARSETRTFLRDVIIVDMDENLESGEDAASGYKRELYAPEIKYIKFHYFDGANWWLDWNVPTLPQIVRITIGFTPEEPPADKNLEIVEDDFLERPEELDPLPGDQYSIMVRVPQADVFFGSRITREASSFGETAGL